MPNCLATRISPCSAAAEPTVSAAAPTTAKAHNAWKNACLTVLISSSYPCSNMSFFHDTAIRPAAKPSSAANRDDPLGRIDGDGLAGPDRGRDVALEAVEEGEVRERR